MTNKEFQDILKKYPDDYQICIDNVFGWETKSNLEDPRLYINSDIGQIEIEPQEYRPLNISTIRKVVESFNKYYLRGLNIEDVYEDVFEDINGNC